MRIIHFLLIASAALVVAAPARPIPADDPPATDESEAEAKEQKLKELIEESIGWYEILPDADATKPLPAHSVLSWKNAVRGETGYAMLAVWTHHGRPVTMASIFPWYQYLAHEFVSLSRGNKLVARDKEKNALVWSPQVAGLTFQDIPETPRPAETPAARLRQMKAIAERFTAVMTGWKGDNSDREELRLLPRPLFRYDLKDAKEGASNLLDGALFAYVMGTDPEIVIALEAVGPANEAVWQYAFARATSGGVEAKLGDSVVWKAEKYPPSGIRTNPNITLQRPLPN
jgi:hypothetical protein